MDYPPDPPLEFANQVIQRLVTNQAGPEPSAEDYRVLRVVFRSLGGTWEPLYHGDMVQTGVLSKVVSGWVGMKRRENQPPKTGLTA